MRFFQAGTMLFGALLVAFFSNEVFGAGLINPPNVLGIMTVTVVAWNALLLIATILVIIDSVKKIRRGMTAPLAADVFVVKLASIPFFVITIALLLLLFFGGMLILVFGGAAMMAGAWIGAPLTYLALLSTSVYGWASIIQLRRERRIEVVLVVLYSIMLLVPVADTVAGILLFVHARRGAKATAIVASAETHDPLS